MNTNGALLDIRGLRTYFMQRSGLFSRKKPVVVKAVDGVDLEVRPGEVVGLVGESGCGKSTLARTVVGLAPATVGEILFEGQDLTRLAPAEFDRVRPRLQLVFQDPYASLNPRMTAYDTLAEPLRVHRLAARKDVPARVRALMEQVGLSPRFLHKYPHEFSGGQRQRIAVARALALEPKLIIADEPVSALDVSVQAQILNLLAHLRAEMDLALLFISHDLSVVKHLSDRIAVMYLGKIVEIGDAEDVFHRPQHPYTRALISAVPVPDPKRESARRRIVLAGDPPSPVNPPQGCPFHPRCPWAVERCKEVVPPLEAREDGRKVACIRVGEIGEKNTD